MKVEIVFKETNQEHGVKKNDIFTYEKDNRNIKTFANGVKIVDDFEKDDYSNEDFLSNLINGLNLIGTRYKINKIIIEDKENDFIIFHDIDEEWDNTIEEYYKLKQIDSPNKDEQIKIKELYNKLSKRLIVIGGKNNV